METIYPQNLTINRANKNEALQRYTIFPLCSYYGNLTDAEAIRDVTAADYSFTNSANLSGELNSGGSGK